MIEINEVEITIPMEYHSFPPPTDISSDFADFLNRNQEQLQLLRAYKDEEINSMVFVIGGKIKSLCSPGGHRKRFQLKVNKYINSYRIDYDHLKRNLAEVLLS